MCPRGIGKVTFKKMKVIIIGGGPAGLSAALFLAKEDVDVTLYEAYKIGENIVCAEGLFDFYGNLDIELPSAMKIKKIIIKDSDELHVNLPNVSKFFTFDRVEWQKRLKEKAQSYGAKIIEEKKISKEELLNLSKENDYVIDASGVKALSHFLFPRKDVKRYRKGLVPTLQYTLEGDFNVYKETIKAIVLNNPPGYYWFFPKLVDDKVLRANAGLGYLKKTFPLPNLNKKLQEIIISEHLDKTKIVAKKASPIPTLRLRNFKCGNIILTGDALGLCSPLHGGGIDSAYLSGFYVAQSLIKNDFGIYKSFLKSLDDRFFKERLLLTLWSIFGSERIIRRLKNKKLFEDRADNIVFSSSWLKRALLKLLF